MCFFLQKYLFVRKNEYKFAASTYILRYYDNDFIILVVAQLEIEKVVSRLTVWNQKITIKK